MFTKRKQPETINKLFVNYIVAVVASVDSLFDFIMTDESYFESLAKNDVIYK